MADQPEPRLSVALHLYQAWWEDNDMWDGYALYLDEDTAKTHAALDYLGYEYSCRGACDDEGTDDHSYVPTTAWHKGPRAWHLLADGVDTLVQVFRTPVYRPSTDRERRQQDALQAAEEAERASRPQKSLTEAFADIAAAHPAA